MPRLRLEDLPPRYRAQVEAMASGLPAMKRTFWTDAEDEALRAYYANTPDEHFSLKIFADKIGRSFASVALRASRLGISGRRTDSYTASEAHRENLSLAQKARAQRDGNNVIAKPLLDYIKTNGTAFKGMTHTEETKAIISAKVKSIQDRNGHPRGMLGKKHTQVAKDAISKANKGVSIPREIVVRGLMTRAANGSLFRPRQKTTWKAAWVELGGKRFYSRSRWEANYARYLQWQKERGDILDWDHEKKTFWFDGIQRGCVSYLPDFWVSKETGEEYHEVKGWMDARSKTKIARMGRYFPDVKMVVIDSVRYRALAKTLKCIIDGWE